MELQCITIHTCGRNCRLYFLAQYGFRFQSASIHLSVHSVEVGKMLFWLVFVWHDHSLISRMFCHHTHWVGPKFRVRVHEKYFISFLHHMMWILCIDMIQPFEYWREMATSSATCRNVHCRESISISGAPSMDTSDCIWCFAFNRKTWTLKMLLNLPHQWWHNPQTPSCSYN